MSRLLPRPPFDLPEDTRPSARSAVLLIYAAIYLKDAASTWVSAPTIAAFLGAGLAVGAFSMITQERQHHPPRPLALISLFTGFALWCLSSLVIGSLNTSAYFLALPAAFVVLHTAPRLFYRLLVLHLLVSLGIQAYEFATNQYLFIYVAPDGTELNENLFGGQLGLFRAKGLFQGPLSAVAFAIWMAFTYRRSLLLTVALFLCAFLASGRLGIVVAALLMLAHLVAYTTRRSGGVKMKWVLVGVTIGAVALVATEDQLAFLSAVLQTSHGNNAWRLFYWSQAVDRLASYHAASVLFGDFGVVGRELGSVENDFLRIGLDNGVLLVGLYIGAMLRVAWLSIRERRYDALFVIALVVAVMNLFPFIQSLPSALLFWTFVWAVVPPAALIANDASGREIGKLSNVRSASHDVRWA
jgi:hypothetical protein